MSTEILPNPVYAQVYHVGAIDGTVVTNLSGIGWNDVVPFSPLDNDANVNDTKKSSYLQWAISVTGFSVSFEAIGK